MTFPRIPRGILLTDGLKPLFLLIRDAKQTGRSSIMDTISDTLREIYRVLQENQQTNSSDIRPLFYTLLEEALLNGSPEEQEYGFWALISNISEGFRPDCCMKIIVDRLHSEEELQSWAVLVMKKLAWKRVDISSYVDHLQHLLTSDNYDIRNQAATTISMELARSGVESKIAVHPAVYENKKIDSYWTVAVYHRRHHALTDRRIHLPEFIVHFKSERICGSCGFANAYCIFYYDDSGTGWTDRTSEYHCPKCGKYTEYHYVD